MMNNYVATKDNYEVAYSMSEKVYNRIWKILY